MTLPPLASARGRDLLSAFSRLHVLVVGDVMLDRFLVGEVVRISPEAPVPVVRFKSEYTRLGGAANVARNVVALGGRAALVGVVGADRAATELRRLLEADAIATDSLVEDPSRPTVEKRRIVTTRNQQVARIDFERDDDVDDEIERQLAARVTALADGVDVLLVSDYLKGTVTSGVMACLVGLANGTRPLLVDPKIPHIDRYRGATLVTPNQQEAEAATHRRIRTDSDARSAAREFGARAGCASVLMTRGEHGMWLSSPESNGSIDAVGREVADVTGAGDTVVAALALALGAGATLVEAAQVANHAAGIVVGKFGPAAVTRTELLAELLSDGSDGAP